MGVTSEMVNRLLRMNFDNELSKQIVWETHAGFRFICYSIQDNVKIYKNPDPKEFEFISSQIDCSNKHQRQLDGTIKRVGSAALYWEMVR